MQFSFFLIVTTLFHACVAQEAISRDQHLDRVNTLYSTLDTWWSNWKYPELNEGKSF
jgi:hypothetical protein